MVHQHFKLVECFSVLDNIILGVEPNKAGFLQKEQAREKVMKLCRSATACASIRTRRSRIFPSACSSERRFSKCSTATMRS